MPIDFRLRDFFHPFGIYRLRRVLERTQWLPPEELKGYQNQRLAVILDQAYSRVPYYRRLFDRLGLRPPDIQGVDELKKLPVLLKDTVRDEGSSLVANNAARHDPVACSTSGSVGCPLQFYRDKHTNMLEFVFYWRQWSWAGYRLGDRFAQLGTQFFLGMQDSNNRVASWQPHLRRLMLNSGNISLASAQLMAEAIRKYRPRFLKGLASSLHFLALTFNEAGIRDLSFRAIFSTGEVLTPSYRDMAESVFGCPVLDSYGHMEGTVAICQCMQGGYHVNSDYGCLELTGLRSSEDGKSLVGRAVGTSLSNLAMPLIRFDVGDDIETFPEPKSCQCGRTLPLVKTIHGRSKDTIVTPDGRFVTAMFVVPELVSGARFVQFIQESISRLRVNVVPGAAWNEEQKERLAFYVRKLAGTKMSVDLSLISQDGIITDASGKIRPVISLVDWKHVI